MDARAPRLETQLARVALTGLALLGVPLALLALLLLASAITWEGRGAAVCALALASAPWLWRGRRVRAAMTAGLVVVALGVWLVARAPSYDPSRAGELRVIFTDGGGFTRLAPTQLVPEGDQLALATRIVWVVDPIMTRASAARLRHAIETIYRRVENDPAYRALGSALGDALTDDDAGRVYLYVPPHAPGERLPAVIFLHGSGGSWKGYFHLWVEFARRRRMIVAQPSFGFGFWNLRAGVDRIERTRDLLLARTPADPSRLYLAGLSNGGRGVTRVLQRDPSRYRGVVLLSAVIEPELVTRDLRGLSVLVIHGARDERIPREYAQDATAALRELGADVRLLEYADEDHYVIFTQPDRWRADLARWMDDLATGTSTRGEH